MHRKNMPHAVRVAAFYLIAFPYLFCAPARAGDNSASQHTPTPPPESGVRRGGTLVVSDPPQAPAQRGYVTRMRTHIEGGLAMGAERVWVGPPVPASVAIEVDGLELFLLDHVEGGLLAFYREPYDGKSCQLRTRGNCDTLARFYADDEAEPRWSLEIAPLMSRPTDLEVHDLRYADGVLYFNEACASYSSQAKGKCSSLIAWDSATRKVLWRSKPLTSNGRFLVHGDTLISGYGFTNERDAIFVVSRKDGRVLAKQRLRTAHETLAVEGDVLTVVESAGRTRRFRLGGVGTKGPKLQAIR